MGLLVSNFATALLDLAVAASSVPSAVANVETGYGDLFPAPLGDDYAVLVLEDTSGNREVVHLTARAGDALTILREQEGTTALTFAAGSRIECRLTAGVLGAFIRSTGLSASEQIINAGAVGDRALTVKGYNGQTADIFEVENFADDSLFAVSADGTTTVGGDPVVTLAATQTLSSKSFTGASFTNNTTMTSVVGSSTATFNGLITSSTGLKVDSASTAYLYLDGDTGQDSTIQFQEAGSVRAGILWDESATDLITANYVLGNAFTLNGDGSFSLTGGSVTPASLSIPNGGLHLATGASSSTGLAAAADDLVVEGSSDVGITVLSPSTGTGSLRFASGTGGSLCSFIFDHDTDALTIGPGAGAWITADASSIDFSKPVKFPSFTSTQRDALSPEPGWAIWNTTITQLEVWSGTQWQQLF